MYAYQNLVVFLLFDDNMRVIAGTYGGRNLPIGKGLPVRPTTDRTREALFNILDNQLDWEGTHVLDGFCGTGSVSIECASRGAASVTSVDQNGRCVQHVKKIVKEWNIDQVSVIKQKVLPFLRSWEGTFQLIYFDPPYDLPNQEKILHTVYEKALLAPGGTMILEHRSQKDFSDQPGFEQVRKYGSSSLSFFH